MAFRNMLLFTFQRFHMPSALCRSPVVNNALLGAIRVNTVIQERKFRKTYGRVLRVMKARRKVAGPDRVRRRSEWANWNYKAELYGFNQRLQENITEDTLRSAFIHDSYIQMEEEKRRKLEIPLQDVQLDIKSNSSLIIHGSKIMSDFLMKYLRHCFKMVPEEGIGTLHDYLTSDEVLSHISSNIGTSELIFCAEYPPKESTLAATLKAIIGGIASDDSVSRAENFVLDFVCPQLIGKDVFDIWDLKEPLEVLNSLLEKHGRKPTESRLIFESGRNTIEAIYHVGLYSDKEFLGRGPGETLAIAEEMAAYDSLRRIFHLKHCENAVTLGLEAKNTEFKSSKENPSIVKWHNELLEANTNI